MQDDPNYKKRGKSSSNGKKDLEKDERYTLEIVVCEHIEWRNFNNGKLKNVNKIKPIGVRKTK